MKWYSTIFPFLLFVLFAKTDFAQIRKIKFNPVEGVGDVSIGKINAMVQDPDGYMWFADQTKSCITRFDGYQMVSFRHDPLNPNSLGGTYPETIAVDREGNIWIGFYGMGVDMYNPKTDTFTHFRHSKSDPSSLASDSVTALLFDREGTLWVGSYGGLDRFDPVTKKFQHYAHKASDPTSISSNRVRSLYEDRQGTIWVGTGLPWDFNNDGGLNRFDKKTGRFTRFLHDGANPRSIANNKVRAIFEDSKGNFWVGTGGSDGLQTMDRLTGLFTRYRSDPANPDKLSRPPYRKNIYYEHITFITEDVTGAIWIGTYESGINHYDPQTGEVTHFGGTQKDGEFPDQSGWSMYSSKDGVLWLSTNESNLYRIDPLRKNIPHFEIGSAVQGFHEDEEGSLWIGTPNGLLLVDHEKDIVQRFVPDSIFQSSKDGYRFSMQPDTKSNLLMVFGNRLISFNTTTRKFKNEVALNNKLAKAHIITILRDRKGIFWIGTGIGLFQLDRKTGVLTRFPLAILANSPEHQEMEVYSLLEDRLGNLWIGTRFAGSVYRLQRSTGRLDHYTVGAMVNCMYEDINGMIWVGTTNGLYQFNQGSGAFSLHNLPGYALNSSDIRNLLEDDQGILWVSSKAGIFKLSKHHAGIVALGKNQGLSSKSLSYAAYRLKSGELLFGDATGYYAFSPDQLTKNTQLPQIVLSNFRISNQLMKPGDGCPLTEPLQHTQNLTLAYNQNTFSFEFAGIHYSNPTENSHLFMLENHEDNWRNAGTERSAHYFNLPPGDYVFKVKAISSDGAYTMRTMPVTIVPAWWNTLWFRLTAGTFLALSLFGAGKWWMNQKFKLRLERSEKEKQLANLNRKTTELEMQALRAQMNPHFIFNSLNSINRFILQNNKVQASEYLTKFSKLIRLILQNSQVPLISLESELESLHLYLELESLRFDHHFDFSVKVDEDIDTSTIKIPPLIIQPYAENAIWHGLMHKEEKGHLAIELFESDGFLCCRISDDGIGRKKASELKSKSASTHKSMGLRITSDRIAMMQQKKNLDTTITIQDLVLADGSAGGTEVLLKIPVMEQN